MSDRYTSNPDDEPVIGGNYAPPPRYPSQPYDEPYIGSQQGIGYGGAPTALGDEEQWQDEYDGYEDTYDEYDEYGYGYDEEPSRQPMFYVFLALAAIVGGIVVFLLFSLISSGDDDNPFGGTDFAVRIDSPPADKRVNVGQEEEVLVQATATEPIVLFELFQDNRLLDSVSVSETPADNRYQAALTLVFEEKGTFEVYVRVTSSSGATADSRKVRLIAVEPVGERPQTISGQVVADTTLRTGPGEQYDEVGQLQAGDRVTILGKSANLEWLLVEVRGQSGGRWARRAAIDPLDTLDLVQIRDVTPTPGAEATPTPEESPTPTETPSPRPDSADFVPTNAVLRDGGSVLRVTVANQSNSPYSGPLVIAIRSETLDNQEMAISADMDANGGTVVVDFDIDPPVTTEGNRVVVEADPQNAVTELREDNNSATFLLLPPEESPNVIVHEPTVDAASVNVTIQNTGGDLSATNITVRVVFGQTVNSQSQSLALASGQTANFSIARPPGQGDAVAEVVINGQVVASASFQLP